MAKHTQHVFSKILSVEIPDSVQTDMSTHRSVAFAIRFAADGPIPFPQVIIHEGSREHLFSGEAIEAGPGDLYTAHVPTGELPTGIFDAQVEGCRRRDWQNGGAGDWVKAFARIRVAESTTQRTSSPDPSVIVGRQASGVKVYFGIHKHMHQPFYRAADPSYWDGEKDAIFASRKGPYTTYLPDAVWQYIQGDLSHAGLSTSWSGSLVEQLDRCSTRNLCGGDFAEWNKALREIAAQRTSLGNHRVAFTSFGFFHPLMPLIPDRDIVKQIARHRDVIREAFGVECAPVLFPPETAFHVRMIPALRAAGVTAVMYDSIHRFRSCKGYPYAGTTEGMLPPNPAEQENAAVSDWLQLRNIWAGSKISPSLLKPEYVQYEDPSGKTHLVVGVPAERYIGNEDARGGYGALQYEQVLGQVFDNIVEHNSFDPKHPPFFILHSDGDNHGGGADSYYRHNTGGLVAWLRQEPRFELTSIQDYLDRFPPDPSAAVHVEPGSWSGADNGDPQFRKWFSMHDQPYSPDVNSWAVLTALQNTIHTLEDRGAGDDRFLKAERLLLTAETSCYWYWTGQEVWDSQVTQAANAALFLIKDDVDRIVVTGADRTGPTIFPPWVTPENPGGKTWGQGNLKDAERDGTVHTLIHDVSGIKLAALVVRRGRSEQRIARRPQGAYPSRTNPIMTSTYYTATLPAGSGDIRFFIEATDQKGNRSVSSLERLFVP